MRSMLSTLRGKGKNTFLITNAHWNCCELLMKATLGDDWLNFFDLVICHAKKPLF